MPILSWQYHSAERLLINPAFTQADGATAYSALIVLHPIILVVLHPIILIVSRLNRKSRLRRFSPSPA